MTSALSPDKRDKTSETSRSNTSGITSKSTSAVGFIKAIESGSKHLIMKRFTLRYPERKLKFVGDGYQFDPKRGVGIAGYQGKTYFVPRQVYWLSTMCHCM